MSLFRFKTADEAENLLLIGGAGDRSTGGGLCLFDGENLETIDRVSTAGLTVFDGHLARLLRTPITTAGGEILVYDSRGISHYLRVDELSDAHYMAWDGKQLVTASTGNNELLWITLSGEVARRWCAPGEGDSWHLNDVCGVDQRLYACAFGRYVYYRDYKSHLSDGDGFVFDVDSGCVVAAGFCAPHSPRHFDGAWTVCDSLRESVVQVDAESGQRRQQAKLRSFTRGLAVTDDYLLVGESTFRNSGEGWGTGSVAILRRSDFTVVTRFEVPFPDVSEIVVVPRTLAEAVKTGFRTNALRAGESDQLQMFRDVGIEPRRLWAVSERLAADQCRIRIDAKIPDPFICGKTTLVECTVKNLSDAFLSSELPHPVNLSYQWRTVADSTPVGHGAGLRTHFPCMLAPGSSLRCRMEVLAPEVEGEFELLITLVQEAVAWFHDIDAANGLSQRVTTVRPESKTNDTPVPTYASL